ncbi:iron dicitrate transport regulator FecR [Sphingobium lactosutens]|uniref:SIS domain-containing protein n=1 Tax=Sphingobium lactosutens TaxID=522773 RepID=UPI0015BC8088|nr:SIS domain-containing protein [Sphingobium lactosutens]NWK96392.1 iron dicitrate transport regulator FecR [Sphingobium lactosutens]
MLEIVADAVGKRPEQTLMYAEAREAGDAVRRFLMSNAETLVRIADRLRADTPSLIVTCGRGSSDHAATFGKYLFETLVGIPTASAALSVASVFAAPLRAKDALCIAISQSGRSPDLLRTVEAYKAAGAFVIVLVNDATSPLADLADETLPLHAGLEQSVAATKSYIASLVGLTALAAHWAGDDALLAALARLPDDLAQAFDYDWSAAIPPLRDARNLFVMGRGYSFAVAQEAALKLKETSGLHAEAFSSAEVRHGPMAIVQQGFPILAFATSDKAGDDVRGAAQEFLARRAAVAVADAADPASALPIPMTHPVIEPILMIQSFYRLVNMLSLARGFDPDMPPHLKKVTQTI